MRDVLCLVGAGPNRPGGAEIRSLRSLVGKSAGRQLASRADLLTRAG